MDKTGKLNKESLKMIVFGEEGDIEIELNMEMEIGGGKIFITPSRELLKYLYTGKAERAVLKDVINNKDYYIFVTATKRDKCGVYYGYEQENVYLGSKKAEFLESVGKSYIRIKKCCKYVE